MLLARSTGVEVNTKSLKLLAVGTNGSLKISLLLHAILLNTTYAPPDNGPDGLSFEDFRRIGTLSFVQLAELRHRGAFSTVAQTFAACCKRCGRSKDSGISGLPETWYKVSLCLGSRPLAGVELISDN